MTRKRYFSRLVIGNEVVSSSTEDSAANQTDQGRPGITLGYSELGEVVAQVGLLQWEARRLGRVDVNDGTGPCLLGRAWLVYVGIVYRDPRIEIRLRLNSWATGRWLEVCCSVWTVFPEPR